MSTDMVTIKSKIDSLAGELNKWQLINITQTIEQLESAFDKVYENERFVAGNERLFDKGKMRSYIKPVIEKRIGFNLLTRKYGLRQQAIYIAYYNSLEA